MKIRRRLIFVALSVAIICGVAGRMVVKREAARDATLQAAKPSQVDLPQATSKVGESGIPAADLADAVAPEETGVAPVKKQRSVPFQASSQLKSNAQNASAAPNPGALPAKESLKDPLARMALALVGVDAEAEAYWYAAINDPKLQANERQDLIEDLNEDGLPDPKHPTAADLPLIVSRLMIIEEVGMEAMDEVNADAFQEAYKDLVNLANLAMGGGEPVR